MEEANSEGREVRALLKDPEGHYGILGDFPFVEEEEGPGDKSEDNQADDDRAGPGVRDSTIFEAKEEHDSAADDNERAKPINCFEAVKDRGFRSIDIEEEDENDESKSIARH